MVQAHDISATILEAAGLQSPEPIDGKSFYRTAFHGGAPIRDHVTVGWGAAMTVIDDQWWFNSKIDGKGAFLHDSPRPPVGAPNLAEQHPEVARELFALGKDDAGGSFPDFVIERAKGFADASGCSPFAAIAGAQ